MAHAGIDHQPRAGDSRRGRAPGADGDEWIDRTVDHQGRHPHPGKLTTAATGCLDCRDLALPPARIIGTVVRLPAHLSQPGLVNRVAGRTDRAKEVDQELSGAVGGQNFEPARNYLGFQNGLPGLNAGQVICCLAGQRKPAVPLRRARAVSKGPKSRASQAPQWEISLAACRASANA
jgi:hypothetical protein